MFIFDWLRTIYAGVNPIQPNPEHPPDQHYLEDEFRAHDIKACAKSISFSMCPCNLGERVHGVMNLDLEVSPAFAHAMNLNPAAAKQLVMMSVEANLDAFIKDDLKTYVAYLQEKNPHAKG